jgi:hypothetical protein
MRTKQRLNRQSGNVLLMSIILIGLGGLVALSVIESTRSTVETAGAKKIVKKQVSEAQAGVGEALSFMRQYSQQMVNPFRRNEFYTHFVKSAGAVAGANDAGNFSLPTLVKLKNTSNSAILFSDASSGTSSFANTWDITSNVAFNAASNFGGSDLGNSKVRITLVNAIADDPAKDYGPPPALMPDTDFHPVYRIDAFTDNDEGAHFHSYMVGDSTHVFDLGIYGQDYLEIRQECDSYISANGAYSVATRRANCPAGSNSTAAVHKNEEIYGSLQTNGSITATAPYGGETCADFAPGCPNKGETCAGEDCGVPLLDIFKSWTYYCPTGTSKPNLNVTGTAATPQVVSVASASAADSCWDGLTIGSNKVAVLTSTANPYYIKKFDLANNGQLRFQPDNPAKPIQIYVEQIVGNKFNGTQYLNQGGKPQNLMIYYLGTTDLVLNGNAAIMAGFVAPKAGVTVQGSFEYHGALLARRLTLTGAGKIHYDESLSGMGAITDMQYRLHDFSQYYR